MKRTLITATFLMLLVCAPVCAQQLMSYEEMEQSLNNKFDEINAHNINTQFDKLPGEFYTAITGPEGIVNGVGTIFLFSTSERNLGKLEILDIDTDNDYALTIRYVTYNSKGETVSKSKLFTIESTAPFDLDNGTAVDVTRDKQDFIWSRVDEVSTSFARGGERCVMRKYQ